MGLPLKVMQAHKVGRLADLEVRRWFGNVAHGSLITADAYLRALFLFGEKMGTTPQALAKLDEKAMYGLLLDFVSAQEKRGLAGRSTLL